MDIPAHIRINPPWKKALGLALVVFILLLSRALTRPLDPDEHQFVAPALLLNQGGLLPYVDYPLFHMPALVWIYAGLTRPFSDPLLVIRVFSAMVGTGSVMLVFWAAFRRQTNTENARRWGVASSIAALYLGARALTYVNGWAWNHDASILTALGAVLLQLHGMRTGRLWPFLLVGILIGLSFTIRLTTFPIVGALALAVLVVPSALSIVRRGAAFILAGVGVAVAVLPTYLEYRAAPEAFLFGNLEYPRLYQQYVLNNNPHHTTFLGKIGHFFQTWAGDIPGNLPILVLVMLALVRVVQRGYWRGKAGMEVCTLLLVLLAAWLGLSAPFQMQLQYHAVLLPFFLLLIVAVYALEAPALPSAITSPVAGVTPTVPVLDYSAGPRERTISPQQVWFIGIMSAAGIALAIQFPRWYWQVVKLPIPSAWTPMQVRKTADSLHEFVPANGRILTLDPIIPLEAGYVVYPQLATGRFVEHIGKYTTAAERQQFGLLYGDELLAELAKDPPGAILYNIGLEGGDKHPGDADELTAYAKAHHFTRRMLSPEYVLWLPPAKGEQAK